MSSSETTLWPWVTGERVLGKNNVKFDSNYNGNTKSTKLT